jgi:hypothetical protein
MIFWRNHMSRITAFIAALAFVASATVVSAGGLAAPEEDDEVIAVIPGAAPVSSAGGTGILLGVGALALVGVALSSGSH